MNQLRINRLIPPSRRVHGWRSWWFRSCCLLACIWGIGQGTGVFAQDALFDDVFDGRPFLASLGPTPVDIPDESLEDDPEESPNPDFPFFLNANFAGKDEKDGKDGKDAASEKKSADSKPKDKKWFEKYSIRGYSQIRYNRLLETNENIRHPQDRSVGNNRGFFIRRARLVFSGEINEWVSVYIQPDFASDASDDRQHFLQIRDWYGDIHLDDCKEHRIRLGQSKVPYGFENLQSSQNRIPLDRNDALNSGAPNERDLGAFYYWAPAHIRDLYKELVSSGLKGSGDYGVFGFGAYNGQSANRPEANDNLHIVARLTYPFQLENDQILELGVGGYRGTFVVPTSGGIVSRDIEDRRIAYSFMLYPKPFGLQGEFTHGEGPELNATRTALVTGALHGGYLMAFYRLQTECHGVFLPFVRGQYYRGGTKAVTNAPFQRVNEVEFGVEWEPMKALEVVVEYAITDRTSTESPYRNQDGGFLRMQFQWNY